MCIDIFKHSFPIWIKTIRRIVISMSSRVIEPIQRNTPTFFIRGRGRKENNIVITFV